jgi:hypothetical protein
LDGTRETARPTLELLPGSTPAVLHHHHKVLRRRASLGEMLRQELQGIERGLFGLYPAGVEFTEMR